MKKLALVLFLIVGNYLLFAQYPIGHRQITYQDPARNNRNVQTEIYYPATVAGDNKPVADGQFPIIVFGHGFVMGVSSYQNIWEALTPLGYIVALPTTEGSVLPSHSEFGKDLAFLINKLKSEGSNSASPFYQKVAATSAMMGHSMGGGASFLGSENNTVPTVMVTLAAAVTNPSSVTAAANVTIPALVISGEKDCVAKPAEHQIPMYNALASDCKVYISIKNGGHCYFANYNFNCTFGEESCYPGGVPLTREEQQATTMNFVIPYLDFFLKGNTSSWYHFIDSLNNSTKIIFQKSCNLDPAYVYPYKNNFVEINCYPNPTSDELNISVFPKSNYFYEITDVVGKRILTGISSEETENINVSSLSNGFYLLKLYINGKLSGVQKFMKR